MNIEHYRNFLQVVEAGSISAGAKILRIAQPALSIQIKALEQELGTALLKRGARRVELTSAGEIFYEKAKNICYLDDAVKKEIETCISGHQGILWLGLTPAYPDPFMGNLLLDFHEAYPQIRFEIFEANSDELVESLKIGNIEIGVIRTPSFIPPMLKASISLEEHLMVVYRKENPWFSPDMKEINITALEGVPLCVSKGFRQKISDSCMEAGFHPSFLSVSSSRGSALMWAARGTAVAIIVSPRTEDQETEDLCCRILTGRAMSTRRSFAVSKERSLSAVAQTFLDFCVERPDLINENKPESNIMPI
ncbi:MAG: LysR family transcriptional regulator [Synergistaceae bacterium]|jgi:DNA-binding transcriptional LysR family regulator|nr:LysR family transcriptional regulator [Synergistaceae bacterium]